jgi:predicted AAA+ superfamily ATPase
LGAAFERVRHGDDVDPRAGDERAADRLAGLDRNRERDLAAFQRGTEAERQLTRTCLEGEPVVDLQTKFGGGKTHSMLALYHLVSGSAHPLG